MRLQLVLWDAPAVGLHLFEGGLRLHRPLLDGQVDSPGRLSKAVRHRPAIPRHGRRRILPHPPARLMHDPEVDLRRHIPLRHRRR